MPDAAKPPPTPEEVWSHFEDSIRKMVGPDGLPFNLCLYWCWPSGKLIHDAMMMDLAPDQICTRLINTVDADMADYLVAGIDMNSRPNQGLEFDDFVLVCEFDRRRPKPFLTSQWRYGVINYRKGDDQTKIVRAVDWANPFWSSQGGPRYMKELGPPFRAIFTRNRDMPQTDVEPPPLSPSRFP